MEPLCGSLCDFSPSSPSASAAFFSSADSPPAPALSPPVFAITNGAVYSRSPARFCPRPRYIVARWADRGGRGRLQGRDAVFIDARKLTVYPGSIYGLATGAMTRLRRSEAGPRRRTLRHEALAATKPETARA